MLILFYVLGSFSLRGQCDLTTMLSESKTNFSPANYAQDSYSACYSVRKKLVRTFSPSTLPPPPYKEHASPGIIVLKMINGPYSPPLSFLP